MNRNRSGKKLPPPARRTARDLGEKELLRHLLGKAPRNRRNPVGIGDDAAVFRPSPGRDLLVSVDTLIEGVDFRLSYLPSAAHIGHKALAANISDIAAMGGQAAAYLVSLSAPGRTFAKRLSEIYAGMRSLARRKNLLLLGGDLSAAPGSLSLTITIFGEIKKGRAVTRSGARPGDTLFLSGPLGDSRAGLEILKKQGGKAARTPPAWKTLVRKHLFPDPRMDLGIWLAKNGWATAMIDISDGLATDLRNLCSLSGVGARFDPNKIPLSRPLRDYCRKKKASAENVAVRGGEDFELLFTVSSNKIPAFMAAAGRNRFRVHPFGSILPRRFGLTYLNAAGRSLPLKQRGFDHFG